MKAILAIVGSLLTVSIGLWKWYFGKKAKRKKLANEGKEGVDNRDPSVVTSIFDKLRK